eukprot:434370-Prorocentrum_minimum.AAC.4
MMLTPCCGKAASWTKTTQRRRNGRCHCARVSRGYVVRGIIADNRGNDARRQPIAGQNRGRNQKRREIGLKPGGPIVDLGWGRCRYRPIVGQNRGPNQKGREYEVPTESALDPPFDPPGAPSRRVRGTNPLRILTWVRLFICPAIPHPSLKGSGCGFGEFGEFGAFGKRGLHPAAACPPGEFGEFGEFGGQKGRGGPLGTLGVSRGFREIRGFRLEKRVWTLRIQDIRGIRGFRRKKGSGEFGAFGDVTYARAVTLRRKLTYPWRSLNFRDMKGTFVTNSWRTNDHHA